MPTPAWPLCFGDCQPEAWRAPERTGCGSGLSGCGAALECQQLGKQHQEHLVFIFLEKQMLDLLATHSGVFRTQFLTGCSELQALGVLETPARLGAPWRLGLERRLASGAPCLACALPATQPAFMAITVTLSSPGSSFTLGLLSHTPLMLHCPC